MDNTQCYAVRVCHKLGGNHAHDIALVLMPWKGFNIQKTRTQESRVWTWKKGFYFMTGKDILYNMKQRITYNIVDFS